MIKDRFKLRLPRKAVHHVPSDRPLDALPSKSSSGWRKASLASIASLGCAVATFFSGQLLTAPFSAAAEATVAEPITPVPIELNLDQRKVQLGRQLFTDSRLSGDNGTSCASCHFFNRGLTDGAPISHGQPGHPGATNTLSLFNVGLSSKLGWDGHLLTLEQQAAGVVENPTTMGSKWGYVLDILKRDSGLTTTFNQIYPDGIQRDNVIDALVEYEKSLTTPNAPFDRYLRGDQDAISSEAKEGYQLFKDYGCASCHQGVNVGGNMLQVFGIFGKPEAAAQGSHTPGAAQNSGISDDQPVFRVPVLRNVQITGPYFHDGSVQTLPEAIAIMAKTQLGRDVSNEDIAKLEAFLDSLTGEYQGVSVGKL
ncbi:cytochrome-c peroxidase [Mesorhizobium sp. GbtcB19]|uniref:cytochrome-c peroxidase n=1 Tax=Mesorhizobium sp. GbtcB19 TaxID=2824764 RepID=UPI001C303C28|nr:cytochrome c peroxidase [Mesorhizobium sp. GbtcB19]